MQTKSNILYAFTHTILGEKNQKLQNYHVRQGPEAAGILVTAPGTACRPGCVGTRLSVAGRRAGTHRYACPRGPQGPWCGRGRSRARARRGAVYGDELCTIARSGTGPHTWPGTRCRQGRRRVDRSRRGQRRVSEATWAGDTAGRPARGAPSHPEACESERRSCAPARA